MDLFWHSACELNYAQRIHGSVQIASSRAAPVLSANPRLEPFFFSAELGSRERHFCRGTKICVFCAFFSSPTCLFCWITKQSDSLRKSLGLKSERVAGESGPRWLFCVKAGPGRAVWLVIFQFLGFEMHKDGEGQRIWTRSLKPNPSSVCGWTQECNEIQCN